MPKVSQTTISDPYGNCRKFDIWYDPRRSDFFVKLPDAFLKNTGINPCEKTEADAIKQATKIIFEYVKGEASRRKVIIVYRPAQDPMSRMGYNGFDLEYVNFTFGIKIVTEVTIEGQRQFVNDRDQLDYIRGEEISVIEWTKEREAFFRKAVESLKNAAGKIREFCDNAERDPALVDKAGPIMLQ